MNNIDEKIENLKKELSQDFSVNIKRFSNITDVILIIENYSPDNHSKPFSFGFSLDIYLHENDDKSFPRKCWITVPENDIISINNNKPKYHIDYKEFTHEEKKYYPYSVQLNNYIISKESIKKLCNSLYQHIKQ